MVKISPSLLSANFLNLEKDIKMMEDLGVEVFHMDVMDGMFVPNISYGPMILKAVDSITDIPMDVHLMIEAPNRYFEVYKDLNIHNLTIHSETSTHLERDINKIKELGMRAGVALNPATPLEAIKYVLKDIDLVLIMSVNPGFGGQKFIEGQLQKIKDLRKMVDENNLNTIIEVDGGVTEHNLREVIDAGANMVVSGSGLFKGDFARNFNRFKEIINEK